MTHLTDAGKVSAITDQEPGDDILELVDAADPDFEDKEEIIELGNSIDDEIIELSGTAEEFASDADDILEMNDFSDQEEVIELSEAAEEMPFDDDDVIELEDSLEEEILELSDAAPETVPEDESVANFSDDAETIYVENENTLGFANEPADVLEDAIVIDGGLNQARDSFQGMPVYPDPETIAVNLSQEQLEKVLEQVVKTQFGDKMESILVEVIEKTVAREIQKIKDLLLKNLAD